MSNPVFYPGKLENNTYTASEAADASYPLINLLTYDPDDKWQSNTTAANQSLKVDLGAASVLNFAVIENHNFDSIADVETVLQCDAADDPAFTDPQEMAVLSGGGNGRLTFDLTQVTKRYVRIYFNSAAALGAKPYCGNLFVGRSFTPANTYIRPYSALNEEFATSVRRAISGKRRSASLREGGVLTWKIRFEKMNDTFRTGWQRFHQAVRGAKCPFYYKDPDSYVWYNALRADANDIDTINYQLNSSGEIGMESYDVNQNPL